MRQSVTIAIAIVLVVSLVGMAGLAVANDEPENESPADVKPGERMSGALGVQEAEVDGEITERGFGIAVANATTDDAAADVVADRLASVDERLDALDERLEELEAQREAGEISEGQYQASVATLEAERASTERLANQSAAVAADLPVDVLEERGISVEHIEELRERAHELTGPEVAEIAQKIAGPEVGQQAPDSAADRMPDEAGPPGDVDRDDDQGEQSDDEKDSHSDADRGPATDDTPASTARQ